MLAASVAIAAREARGLKTQMHTGSLAGRPCAWRQQGGNQIFAVVIAAVLVLADEAGNGADRLAMRQQKLKCGTNCGSCLPELKRIANTGKAGA